METTNKEKSKRSRQTVATEHVRSQTTWVEIDKRAFDHNVIQYKNSVQPALFAPVLKSNAYGHGIELIAKLCELNSNVDRLCVALLTEAIFLRSIGIKKPILVLSCLDTTLDLIVKNDITVVVCDTMIVHALNQLGKRFKKRVHVHIKIDTGLSRLGIPAEQAFEYIKSVAMLPFIYIEGIFTHFANSESADQHFLHQQLSCFNRLIQDITDFGLNIPLLHSSCSAAITAHKATHYTMARAGIGIYGLWPSQDNEEMTKKQYPSFTLKPVLTWKTTVIFIKEVKAGSYIGYDCTHRVDKATRIAVLPVGYWDGYDRRFSNNGSISINGYLVPVVGRVSMNLIMVDIGDHVVAIGDEAVLLGDYPGVTARNLASRCTTIEYDIVTNINPLLPRILVDR